VNPLDALQIANPIMNALLQMLSFGDNVTGGVQEDALMAIGTLVEGMWRLIVIIIIIIIIISWNGYMDKSA